MGLLDRWFGRKSEKPPALSTQLVLEPTGSRDFGPCECCGSNSRTVWGAIRSEGAPEAAYFVHWTLGAVRQRGARFRLVLGEWGSGTTREDRFSVALELRWTDQGPQFMVQDSQPAPGHTDELVGRHLRRDEVIGTPLASRVFSLVDQVWAGDGRIREVTEAGAPGSIPSAPRPAGPASARLR